ncbi:hypothetical protein K2173_016531 [Erythroxylum novogranatense]|uniref:Trehalose-phosphatase n=1 Tax=Erythroxylum novogranatense TaxID=1862640 RepID=A0AAV8SH06_9ROSI|nr:hypothetical protein K2173_016531 [Erythroxylum novogranatense]
MDEAFGIKSDSLRTSMLVVYEFIGCSPSLSGAIRVNPWDIDAVADALILAITVQELRSSCAMRSITVFEDYQSITLSQLIKGQVQELYFWTTMPLSFHNPLLSKATALKLFLFLKTLSEDPKNTVFIVSGRGTSSLSEWLASCDMLGIAAEHGHFIRWNKTSEWEIYHLDVDLDWKKILEPVMRLYTEATDGSSIEIKESALVWHHQDADPDFGSRQAKELLDHIESALANEPAVVKRGQHIVEVKPQGVSKGFVTERVLMTMAEEGKLPDFVICIGDDRSDEDMFERILRSVSGPILPAVPEIFACTVGKKPSKAKYYLDVTADVVML